jgi:hypothetical protein
MKEYRITSADFVDPNESLDPDAFMGADDLRQLKKLAGLGGGLLEDYYTAGGHDPALTTPNDDNGNTASPVGSTMSQDNAEKRRLEKELYIRVGDPEWFRLWFAKPWLTGEKPVGDAPADHKPIKIDVSKSQDTDPVYVGDVNIISKK